MLLDIAKIKVGDRIREDFGNIDKLAENIKEHGLINPITVTPQYELIAGERRLRALKKLGYKQVEVNVIAVEDAEQQLKLEISENTARKNFTPEEILIYGRQLERIESARANERKVAGKGTDHKDGRPEGQARDIVASNFGISGRQYERMKEVDANKDSFSPEDYENWKNGEKSTNSMLAELRAKKDAEKKRADEAEAKLRQIESENERLRNRKPEVVEKVVEKRVEVKPKDYEIMKNDYERVNREREQAIIDKRTAEERVRELEERNGEATLQAKLETEANALSVRVAEFIRATGGYVWITGHFNELPEQKRKEFEKSIMTLDAWAQQMIKNMRGE